MNPTALSFSLSLFFSSSPSSSFFIVPQLSLHALLFCAPPSHMHAVSFIINTIFIISDISWERCTQPCKLTHMFAHTRWHTHTSWIIKAMCRGTDRAGDDLFGQAGMADSEPPSHGPTFTAFITTCNISPIPPFNPLYLATSPDRLCIPPSLSIHHCITNPPVLFNFLSITLSPLWCLHLEVRQWRAL